MRRAIAARDHAAGFTLLEVTVVLAILGVMTALIAMKAAPVSPATHAKAVAEALAGAMRAARGQALVSGRSVFLTLDVASGRYAWGDASPKALPSDVRLSLLTGRELAGDGGGRIRFDPDGGSSGGRVTLIGGDRTWAVGVDWLSGRVSLAQQAQ